MTLLESRYAGWDGLNLTWETLEGLAKHNGPLRDPPPYIADYNARHKLDLGTHASAEAQVAAMADDIAYHAHDLDDGLRARLFTPDDLRHLPIVGRGAGRGAPGQPRHAAAAAAARDHPPGYRPAGVGSAGRNPRAAGETRAQGLRRDPPVAQPRGACSARR